MDVTLVAGIDPFTPRASGIRTHVLGLAGALARLGHRVAVVGTGTPKRDSNPWTFVPVSLESRLSSFRFLSALHRKARTLPIAGAIVHAHRPDDLTAFALRKDALARVLTVHGISGPGIAQRHGRAVSSVYARLERVAMRIANRIVVLDRRTYEALRSSYPRHSGKLAMGSGGVDLQVFRPKTRSETRLELGIDDRPTVAFVGRLVPEKNLEILMQALDSLESVQVVIAGDGPLRSAVKKWGQKRSHFRFLGQIHHEEVPTVLNSADVLALPSVWEAMPAVSLESLACGTPVATTRVGGLEELIQDGVNGFLAGSDSTSLARSLTTALTDSERMRPACRKSVERFDWVAVAKRLVEIYSEAAQ